MNLKELNDRLATVRAAATAICDEVDKAGRDFTADEKAKVEGYLKEGKDLKAQIKQAEGDAEMRKQIADLGAGLELTQGPQGPRQPGSPAGKGRTLGEQFISAPAWKSFLERYPNGVIPESSKNIQGPPIEMKTLFKDLLTGASDTSAGAFVEPDYTGIYEPLGRRPRTLLDLIPRGSTRSDIVWFIRQVTRVAQAAPVPEANVTEYTGATGQVAGEKSEGSFSFEQVSEPVRTIAVWIPATKRALSDAAQLRSIIDLELREDTQEELENQVYDGDGVGENFRGIVNTSGHLTQAWDTDILTTARKAKTAVLTIGHARPTAWVMNPEDWETIELLRDENGRFYGNGPFSAGPNTLWGLPVVEAECMATGHPWLADWRKCRIWDREQASITVSDSHSDFFIRNMIAILCELRAAFGVIRPSAFCEVEFEAGS